MKKYIVIPIGIFLIFSALAAYYTYSRYNFRVEARKRLLESYASNVKIRINHITQDLSKLPYVVQSIVDETGISENDPDIYSDYFSILEKYYTDNSSFIRGISIYDKHSNVLNVYRESEGRFIKDNYKSRSMNVLRSDASIVSEKNSYSIIMPVFQGGILSGNISLSIDMEALQEELFKPYIGEENVWPTSVTGKDDYATFPLEAGLTLSRQNEITTAMEENGTGYIFDEIYGDGYKTKIITYYESIPASGYFFGILFSYNISPIIRSSALGFAIICLIALSLTIASIIILYRILARQQKEKDELERRISLIQSIYQNIPVGFIVSKQNRFFNANTFAFHLLKKYISQDDIGKEISKIPFPPDFGENDEQSEFKEWNITTIGLEGEEVCLGIKKLNLEVEGTKYTVYFFWDITDMEDNRKNAIRSEIAKSELLSRITNDIKKPLDNIKDALVLLTQKYPDDPTILHITDSAKTLSYMMDDTQDFADIEAGRIVLDEVPFNIVDELKKITDEYSAEARKKGIALQAHIASSVIRHVVGDPQRFRQILDQLLSNAVKFTDHGEIRISIETVKLNDNKVVVKCSIEDTGKGMSKKKLKNLFSVDLRAKEAGESIGLGIIVAKKLVSIMGGTIRVTSPSPVSTSPDAPGTQFSFSIICHSDPQMDKKLDFSSIASYDQIGVLIIASEIHDVQYLNNYMKRKNIQADTYILGKDMEELLLNKLIIDKSRYQIVIIETKDSATNLSLAEKINEQGLSRQAIYIMIDPYNQKGNYLKAKNLSVDYYFKRREDLSDLDKVLKTHFGNVAEKHQPSADLLRKDIRILVAENNLLSQSVANLVFKQLGYEIDFAGNALDLVSQMNKNSYDIIFMDLKFPPSDGFEIAGMLRQKGYKLPIIAMTSTLTKENMKNISDCGLNGYIPKPLNPENLKNILHKWFV